MAYGAVIRAADGSVILDTTTFTARVQGVLTVTTTTTAPYPYITVPLENGQTPFFYTYGVNTGTAYCWVVGDKIYYQTNATSSSPVKIFYGAK